MGKSSRVALLATLTLLACGGDDTQTADRPKCDRVLLGTRGDEGNVFASVENPQNVDCATAREVVRQWGRQQAGLGDAKLPQGWVCDGSSVCSKGIRSVRLTLQFGDQKDEPSRSAPATIDALLESAARRYMEANFGPGSRLGRFPWFSAINGYEVRMRHLVVMARGHADGITVGAICGAVEGMSLPPRDPNVPGLEKGTVEDASGTTLCFNRKTQTANDDEPVWHGIGPEAPDAVTAARWCADARQGRFGRLMGATEIEFQIPGSDTYPCELEMER